jgi:MFS family permease
MPGSQKTALEYTAVLAVAVCCYLALGVVLPWLPGYVKGSLGAGALAVGLVVGAPALSAVGTRPAGGRAADRLGPRSVVVAGAAVMSAGATLGLAHPGVARLVGARLAVGAGEGAMMGAAVAWLLRLSRPDRRGRALGHIGLANYLGLTLGPLLGELLPGGDALWLAAAAAPALAAVTALLLRPLPPSEAAPHSRLIVRETLRPGAGLALTNVGYAAVISFAGLALAARHLGVGAHIVAVYAGTVALLRIVAGSVPDRLGARVTVMGASATSVAGLALLAAAHSGGLALAATVITAAGQSLLVPALGLLVLERTRDSEQGAVAGTFFAFFDIGVGAGSLALGAIARAGSPVTAVAASAVAVAAVAFVAGAWRPRRDLTQDAS